MDKIRYISEMGRAGPDARPDRVRKVQKMHQNWASRVQHAPVRGHLFRARLRRHQRAASPMRTTQDGSGGNPARIVRLVDQSSDHGITSD